MSKVMAGGAMMKNSRGCCQNQDPTRNGGDWDKQMEQRVSGRGKKIRGRVSSF